MAWPTRRRTLLLADAADDTRDGDLRWHEADTVSREAVAKFQGFWGADPRGPELERLLAVAADAVMPEYRNSLGPSPFGSCL